ncbi:peptidylprolyl isomerase [Vagococcus intermedius]|uniref:Peptidyl-prolyl cis-trans isomerase n=1 Tax=Vagococcus intermedius TaxID=2991418 RepID=A0AAF0CTH3_9ENTE|nr:peptidylprolyl isomerase [Vagococcus intermedius]WEG72653.1 peptidylprolyl isomerase [Vagococcus intermedius]WEG74738.1 peptidylprolyl isomerase [Vagococcus intermedius]
MKKRQLLGGLTILTLTLALTTGCANLEKLGITKKNDTTEETTTTDTTQSSEAKINLNSLVLPQLDKTIADNESAVKMVTSEGTMTIKLFPELAPKAVENFMTHAKEGYYNKTKFHRVIKDFMIQGGDPKGTGVGGESIWQEEFAPEISNQLYHINGALAMARTNGDVSEKTQGSQFYIVQNHQDTADGLLIDDYPEKIIEAYRNGGTPFLDKEYSVFGQVIEGLDVIDKIANVEVEADASGGQPSKPKKDVTVKSIKIIKEASKPKKDSSKKETKKTTDETDMTDSTQSN